MTGAALPVLYLLDASVAVTGAFTAARSAAQTLAGVARIVLVLPQGSTIAKEELLDFWRVEYLPITGLSKNLRAMLRYVPALFCASWRLKKLMKKDGATRLQLNDFYLMHGAMLRVLGYQGHIAAWVRCDPKRFAGPLTRPMLWLAWRSANRLVAVSAFVRSLLPAGYSAEVIYDCYNGPVRAGAGAGRTFVFIGNYMNGKGQDIALRAFHIAAAEDASLKLAFYGGDMGLQKNREYRRQLETFAREQGLEARVHFGDFVANPFTVLEGAFAALNFSVSESFSMTVLEASGAGVPVIATASGGPQEIVEEGVTGFLVPVGDVAAAARRMLTLAQNPDAAAAMGEAGAGRVQKHFSQDAFRARLLSVLDIR